MIDIKAFIEHRRFPLENEKCTQGEIALSLLRSGIEFAREYRLNDADIVDFMINGTAVEVKLRAARMLIYRQLERYSKHEEVKRIVLVTLTPMHLPPEINGKPAIVASLGRGWL